MKKIAFRLFVFCLFGTISITVSAQNMATYNQYIDTAHIAIQQQDYEKALGTYITAFSIKTPKNPVVIYEAAVMAARLGQKDFSFMLLNWSVDEGFGYYDHMKDNQDFPKFNDQRFDRCLDKVKQRDSLYKVLTDTLDLVFRSDQDIRNEYIEYLNSADKDSIPEAKILARMSVTDSSNLVVVERLIDKYGFLGNSLGTVGSKNAMWAVIQHSPIEVMESYDSTLAQALESGELSPGNYALIVDRISLTKTGKQKYGSQFKMENGEIVISPLQDPENVDIFRKEVGLMPMEEYINLMRNSYGE